VKNSWKELIANAAPFVNYLNRDSYFEKKYSGQLPNTFITSDPTIAIKYASDDSGDMFDDWASVSDSPSIFPNEFEWKSWIDYNLLKNNYFNINQKNFNGADIKLTTSGVYLLHELMYRDMRIILNCYANEYFPDIWRVILESYLNDGFPCGWNDRYPSGQVVIFSNEP
jgi:hypothetical protein